MAPNGPSSASPSGADLVATGPTIAETARALRRGETTSEQVTRDCLTRIARHDASLNAFITVRRRGALADARRADRERATGIDRGPLHGVPISVKDLIDLAGTPTTAASRVRPPVATRTDAPVVARLRAAGAILIGKCNLHEFAYGTTSDESAYGAVHHPRDLSRSPGGSSGGSAVSILAGMCAGSVGTDTGGSIRIPAALCGLVGLKPGYGELSCEGVVPLSESLDHVGPLARTVEDAWILYRAMRGDGTPGPARATGVGRIRLGIPIPYFFEALDPDVRAAFETAVDRLRSAGARTRRLGIAHAADSRAVYLHIQAPEASAYHARMLEERPAAYTPGVRLRLEAGRYLLAEDFARARRGQEVLRRSVDAALEGLDALLLPTVAIPPPPIGAAEWKLDRSRSVSIRGLMLKLTQLFNITGHPAITIPAGGEGAAPSVGLQLVGRRGGTEPLLALARAGERALR